MTTTNHSLRSQVPSRQRFHLIDSLGVNLHAERDRVRLEILDPLRTAGKSLDDLGHTSECCYLSGRQDVVPSIDAQLPHWSLTVPLRAGDAVSIPLPDLMELQPKALDSHTTPAEPRFAAEADQVILGPGLSRQQRVILGRHPRPVYQVLDQESIDWAGAGGSWPDVFQSSELVVLTARAARSITASASTNEAVPTLERMSRNGAFLLLDDRDLIVWNAGRSLRVTIPGHAGFGGGTLMACAAIAAAARHGGHGLEGVALAVAGFLAESDPPARGLTTEQLVQRGKEYHTRWELDRVRRANTRRVAGLLGTAALSAAILITVSLSLLRL